MTQDNKNQKINVSGYLKIAAAQQPFKRAVVYPAGRDAKGRVAYSHYTFQQLENESDYLAHGLESFNIKRGTRTILMVKLSLEFVALTFALFKIGAVPVIVDPGMGLRALLHCFKASEPEAFIGIPIAHMLRITNPKYFKSVKHLVTVGRRWLWGGRTLDALRNTSRGPYDIAPTIKEETAAILFTTGSTGPPKGVVYTHGMFDAQLRHIKAQLEALGDIIDLPTFPLFTLFDPALGITSVLPDMDPTKPAKVNPQKIIEAIVDQGVNNMFASPALLNRVGAYGKNKGIKLKSLKRVVSAGAPVSADNIAQFSTLLCQDGEIHTPYGATEALPVTSISGKEILNDTSRLSRKGAGVCVGRPVNGIDIRIIKISDDPIEKWTDELPVSQGDVGEIVVKGDLVTRCYYRRPEADIMAKIRDGDNIWHRMGDLGWCDEKGRIWFCGRKCHRVPLKEKTLFTVCCEMIINTHPKVFRSALVGVGTSTNRIPVMCIELKHRVGKKGKKSILHELRQLAWENDVIKEIKTFLFCKTFPTDIRHNSKIFREKLAVWAQQRLRPEIT